MKADILTLKALFQKDVRHTMNVDKAERHRMTRFASIEGDLVTYPPSLSASNSGSQ